jgi:hypothetical protein
VLKVRKDAAENVIKIVRCLKEAEGGWLWVREIARRTNLHHKTVSRLIDKHLEMFVETQAMEPFNVHMIRLKPNTDVNGIFRFLAVKDRIDEKAKRKDKVTEAIEAIEAANESAKKPKNE